MTEHTVALRDDPTDLGLQQQHGLARYQPANLKQLVWFAGEVAKSGMYSVRDDSSDRTMTQPEVFMVMSEGVEMGLTPLQAMRNIYLIIDGRGRKSTVPRADFLAARIQAHPSTEQWDVDDQERGLVHITAKRRGRSPVTMSLSINEIPARDRQNWQRGGQDEQEMLVNRCIRRMARRHFKDMVLGLDSGDVDESRVVDVQAVETQVGRSVRQEACPHCGRDGAAVIAAKGGGAFLRCSLCGFTAAPPQDVRDAIRGHKDQARLEAPEEVMHTERAPSVGLHVPQVPDAGGAPPPETTSVKEVMPTGPQRTGEPPLRVAAPAEPTPSDAPRASLPPPTICGVTHATVLTYDSEGTPVCGECGQPVDALLPSHGEDADEEGGPPSFTEFAERQAIIDRVISLLASMPSGARRAHVEPCGYPVGTSIAVTGWVRSCSDEVLSRLLHSLEHGPITQENP
jgi:transcription elongation factor Elf1